MVIDKNLRFRKADLPPRVAIWALDDSGFEYNGVVYMMEWGDLEGDPPSVYRATPSVSGPFREPEITQMARVWARSDGYNMPLADFLNATLGGDRG